MTAGLGNLPDREPEVVLIVVIDGFPTTNTGGPDQAFFQAQNVEGDDNGYDELSDKDHEAAHSGNRRISILINGNH